MSSWYVMIDGKEYVLQDSPEAAPTARKVLSGDDTVPTAIPILMKRDYPASLVVNWANVSAWAVYGDF